MAKSFKKILSEVAEPKAAGERAFKAQHTVEKIDAQPAGQEHIFNGEIPPKKRLADYMKGQDEAEYDKASKLPDQGNDDSIVDMGEETEEEGEDLTENPAEEKPMMMGQLRMMAHNLQGIARYVQKCPDCEEWFQNKLAGVAKEMQTLYGYATAEVMAMGESLEEASCGCGPDCEHCGGDHANAEIGEKCDCCGNMIEEAYRKPTAAEIRKDKERERKASGKNRPSMSYKDIKKKVYGNMMGGLKEESIEEAKVDEDAFRAKAAHSKMAGKDKMKMGDKEYPVTMKKVNAAKIVGEENVEEARRPKPPKISKGTAKGSISAKGIRGKGMKKFDVDVSVDNGKFSFRITDESGAFQTVDIKKAARMLGEEAVAELEEISKGLAGRYLKKAPARAADAGEKLARASQAYDKESGAKQRKKSIRTFLNTQKGVERATNRLMKKEDIDESLEEKKRQQQGRKLTPKEMRRALQTAKAQPKDKVSLKKAPFDIPKESVELEEKVTFKTGIITLDDGQKVKLSRQDADLLTKFFRNLNPRNSTEMRKVLVTDKAGFEEILGFAREAL